MRTTLSAIALGASLACACQVAAAGPTVFTIQQGTGNTSSVEQVVDPTADATVQIVQIGNNNRVGGPGGPVGVIQKNVNPGYGLTAAMINQVGNGNNASIRQDNTIWPVNGLIWQTGNRNSATIRQEGVQYSNAVVEQSGTGNVVEMEQVNITDSDSRASQTGTGNRITISQNNAVYGGPQVSQTGDGNTASVMTDNFMVGNSLGAAPRIVQVGSRNQVNTVQTSVDGPSLYVQQQGTGNRADVTQMDGSHVADIDQNGNNNQASITQGNTIALFMTTNMAFITQSGNSNSATVRQFGDGYVASVGQVGSGNWTNIYQH